MSAATAPQGARELLENMLGHLGFAFTLEEEKRGEDNVLHVRMQNPARLIGRDGETVELEAAKAVSDRKWGENRLITLVDSGLREKFWIQNFA